MKKIKNILAWFSPFKGPQVYDHRERGVAVTMVSAVLALTVIVLAVAGMIHWINR
jgi:hypothetical protein